MRRMRSSLARLTIGLASWLALPGAGAWAVTMPQSLDSCEEMLRAKPGDPTVWRCFWYVGRSKGKGPEAARRLRAQLQIEPANAAVLLNLGRIEADQGMDEARAHMEEAVRIFQRDRFDAGEFSARLALTFFCAIRNDHACEQAQFPRLNEIAAASGNADFRANVLVHEALHAGHETDFGRELALMKQAEAVPLPEGPYYLKGHIQSGLVGIYWALGRHREAFEAAKLQAENCRLMGDTFEEAHALHNMSLLGRRLIDSGDLDSAQVEAMTRAALDAAQRSGNIRAEASVRLSLAQEKSLSLTARRREAARALELGRRGRLTSQTCFALRQLATIGLTQDPEQMEESLALVDEAIALAERAGELLQIARGWIVRASFGWHRGEPGQALRDSLTALDAVERVRDLQPDDQVRTRFAMGWTLPYYRFSGQVLERAQRDGGKVGIATGFAIMERLRGRVLLDAMDAMKVTQALSPDVPDLRRPRIPPLEEVQGALDTGEAILAFQVAADPTDEVEGALFEGGSWLLVVTRDGAEVHRLPSRSLLQAEVTLYEALIQRRDGSDLAGAVSLYGDLLADALPTLPSEVRRLIVIPDDVLHRLPFDALREAPAAAPIGARYEISIAPSATLWMRWRQADRVPTPRAVLALADPDLSTPGASAPEVWRAAGAGGMPGGHGRLPRARREARSVTGIVGGASLMVTGGAASESFLKSADFSRFGMVHLAAHAVVDEQRPERSAVLLASDDPREDGLLQMRDVAGLQLGGRAIVLAACGSSSGALFRGEGAMSLARAFFQAGARAVVGSLWPLRDDESARFIDALYRHLARGGSMAGSLAAARRGMIERNAPTAAWAGLVVLGDGDMIPMPADPRGAGGTATSWWLAAGAAVLVSVMLAGALRRRRRRG